MPTCRSARWLPTTLGLLLLLGCTDSKPGQSDAVVPRWRGAVDLTIGPLEGTPDHFGAISGVAHDASGRIFIADAGNHTVAAYDSSGRFLYDIGREGRGPGEVQGPCCLATDSQGHLWVRDAFNSRYHRYLAGPTDAELIETRRATAVSEILPGSLTFDGQGRLVDVATRPASDRRTQLIRSHLDSAGQPARVDTILAPPNDSLGTFHFLVGTDAYGFINQPYGPRFLIAHAPGGGWARAVSSRYLVTWVVHGDSGTTQTIRRDLIGPALSARERQEADSSFKTQALEAGRDVTTLPFGVPGSKTPVHALMFDQQGRLWVQLNVGDGENNRADVWDATGRRVGNAEWPAGVDLRRGLIDDRVAYGVQQDSAGVTQVVRVRFR